MNHLLFYFFYQWCWFTAAHFFFDSSFSCYFLIYDVFNLCDDGFFLFSGNICTIWYPKYNKKPHIIYFSCVTGLVIFLLDFCVFFFFNVKHFDFINFETIQLHCVTIISLSSFLWIFGSLRKTSKVCEFIIVVLFYFLWWMTINFKIIYM